ncbi:MAG: hypothetical protein GY861_01650 [bacterium]|nr:hypothetical protein [bacterium]
MRVYKIRRKKDSLFSDGKDNPSFVPKKQSKSWKKVINLRAHLREVYKLKRMNVYNKCEIVTYDSSNLKELL